MSKGTTVRMWRRTAIMLGIILVIGFGTLIIGLFKLQIIDGNSLYQMAAEQQLNDTKIEAKRGTIYDCNMKPLAISATVWDVVLEPAYITTEEEKALISNALAEILSMDSQEIRDKIDKNSKSYYCIIKKKIEVQQRDAILEFESNNNITQGIRLIESNKRYYPYGSFASRLIGFTGNDAQGLSGLENYYNDSLSGIEGRMVTARNAIGTDMPFEYEQMVPATDGYSLVLTIDEVIQHFLEKSLEEGIAANDVRNGATAIMMDVNTGAILGMAVKDKYDFDLNNPYEIADPDIKAEIEALPEEQQGEQTTNALMKQWRNKAVSDTYYPGSVFKMVTASMCLQESLYNEDSMFVCGGSIRVGSHDIGCHYRAGHGSENFVRALCNSCNPAFATMGLTLGNDKFYQYYSAFGFSERTGIDLPGEAEDIFFSKDGTMSETDLAVASFGQNFSITPIQMLTAAAAIANGGNLVTPHVVEKVVDNAGNIISTASTHSKRQVISKDVSDRMCAILQQNAIDGSGANGYIEGYRIAGKTGTSEKIADYNETGVMTYIASYCGFAPADNPQVAMLVYYDNPQGGNYYGAMVAAPTFKSAMQEILPYLGVEKQYTDEELEEVDIKTPNVMGKDLQTAISDIINNGLNYVVNGSGSTVVAQIPKTTQSIPRGGKVILYTDQASYDAAAKVAVPNFVNMTMAQVNELGMSSNLNISISGSSLSGDVVSVKQSIPEGTQVEPGTVVTVTFAARDSVL